MMKVCLLTVLATLPLLAAYEHQLSLALQAQTAFDRVNLAATPQLRDATACVQAQASYLPLASIDELPLVHYRKGYCALTGAASSQGSSGFSEAAAEFDKAVEAWKVRVASHPKNGPLQPVPSPLRVLSAVARIEANREPAALEAAAKQIMPAVDDPVCNASLTPAGFCEATIRLGRAWLGWIALQQDDLFPSARNFSNSGAPGWPKWVAGRLAFQVGNYAEAAGEYGQAIGAWRAEAELPAPSLIDRLNPPPDLAASLTEWGGVRILSDDAAGAIQTLDDAVKADPSNARAIYLRGRAKELAGQSEAALTDYNLASRTAFANATDLASGEAHLYRGILMLRRKNPARAEDEFSSALNFAIPDKMRADAEAWRHMAAVESGSCTASRGMLEQSLARVSPYFPKSEARAALAACSAGTSASIGGGALK